MCKHLVPNHAIAVQVHRLGCRPLRWSMCTGRMDSRGSPTPTRLSVVLI